MASEALEKKWEEEAEATRMSDEARNILVYLLVWWRSCYEHGNPTGADTVWTGVIKPSLPKLMSFIDRDEVDLFNSFYRLHLGFFRKEKTALTLEMELVWLREWVAAGLGGCCTYQAIWEDSNPVHKEVRLELEDGLLKELETKGMNGYDRFCDRNGILFDFRKRGFKSPRSFFLYLQREYISYKFPKSSKNICGGYMLNAEKVRSLMRRGLKAYPAKKKI